MKSVFRGIWGRCLFFLLASLALSVVFYVVIALIFSTREEKKLALENELIREEYENMEKSVERLENVVAGLEERDREIYRDIFEAEPPSLSLEGNNAFFSDDMDSIVSMRFVDDMEQRLSEIEDDGTICGQKIKDILSILSSGYVVGSCIPSMVPVPNFNPSKSGASVGLKVHPLSKKLKAHNGIDIVVPEQTDVCATADGVVSEVSRKQTKEGNSITIDHGNGYVTRYTHLGNVFVRKGMSLRRGALIASVGNSGSSFAPHLHYEVIFRGRSLEPVHFFFSEQNPQVYRQTMLVALNNGQSMD